MNVSIIGVPIFLGSGIKGVELGPKKFREKDISKMLEEQGHTVYDCGNIWINDIQKYKDTSHIKYLKSIVSTNNNLANDVYSNLCAGNFPLVLGGDHSLGLGSISGASRFNKNLAVIWIDAHGDINTDKTSPTGNIHGMPLAAAMGIGNKDLVNTYYDGPKIKAENVFILGARSLDPGEKDLIKSLNINVYSTEDINNLGIEKILKDISSKLKFNNIKNVHLSFDIDVLDPKFVPGTGTPVSEGVSVMDIKNCLRYLMGTNLIKSMDIVELNPALDKDDMTSDLCMDLISTAFKSHK